MKKLLLIAACVVATVSVLAQGTVNFANKVTASNINAPVTNSDGKTLLEGAAFLAQLYAGPTETSLAPVGSPVAFKVNGYFSGGKVEIPTVAGGAKAYAQVRAWEASGGNSYEVAMAAGKKYGFSNTIQVTTGNPLADPPGLPADLVGLTGFSLIPEPSTIALGLLGVAALLLRRRS